MFGRHMIYRELATLSGRIPIPQWMTEIHRSRVRVWDFMGAADYTAADWNVNAVGTGAAALASSNGGSINGPCLQLTASVATDGVGLRHNAMHFQMPTLAGASSQHLYLAFDICPGTLATSAHRAFGLATGTAAQAFNVDTGALFSAGGGIMWQSVNNGAWALVYKPSAKSAVTIATASLVGLSTSAVTRLGFLVLMNPRNESAEIGKIIGFAHSNIDLAFSSGDTTDDQDGATPESYYPSVAGRVLDDTTFGDSANVQAGIFMGHGTEAAGARSTFVRRIVSVDNMRR